MIYLDDEVRAKFHKTNFSLQVLLSIMEHYLAQWHLQIEVIDVLFPHQVLVGVPKISEEVAIQCVEYINSAYGRKEPPATIKLEQPEYGTFTLYCVSSKDFLRPL